MVRAFRRPIFVTAAALGFLFAADLKADPNKAIQEFREGRALVVAGKCEEAVRHFQASLEIAVAVGPLMNLGECQAKLGKLASAVRSFEQASELALQAGDLERQTECERMLATLKPSTLTIRAPGKGHALVDGEPQPFGVTAPIDGGDHEIVIESGAERRGVTIHVAESGEARVFEAAEPPPRVTAEPPPRVRSSPLRTAAYITGGAGILGLAVGSIFGVMTLSTRGDLDEACPAYPECPASRRGRVLDLQDSADTQATIATIALSAGLVLAATTVALYLWDAKR